MKSILFDYKSDAKFYFEGGVRTRSNWDFVKVYCNPLKK